ncbi:MAG: cyclase family protein [Chloroflexota bacterium]|nr:cyclase family protein [Chloroflexota bacterium]
MIIYDISVPVSSVLPVWPGDPRVSLERLSKIEEGADANVTFIRMSAHTGTHIDAPYHFLGGDNDTVDQLPLELLIGPAYVLHVPVEVNLVKTETLQALVIPEGTTRLLIKTRNSNYWQSAETEFMKEYVAISPDAARYLIERGIQVIGVDYLSVAPFDNTIPTHRILLEAGVLIIEGLNLSGIDQTNYELYCLPLNLIGTDGAPARAVLTQR